MGALRARKHRIDGGEDARTICIEGIERAGGGKAFQHPFVDRVRVDAPREIGQVDKRPLAAGMDDRLDCLAADTFECGERVMDGRTLHLEIDAGPIDRRRLDLHAQPLRLGAKLRKLVGIAHVERHGRGEKLDRVIRLHESGLIRDQCISGGVTLVEAVISKTREQFENSLGLALFHGALDAAGYETAALLLHFTADLLPHGAPQQVGFAERIAGEDLRRLHHLLLVHDDAKGLA